MDVSSLCKKTPITALFSFLKQSFTNVNSLGSKISKALSLTFSYKRHKYVVFLQILSRKKWIGLGATLLFVVLSFSNCTKVEDIPDCDIYNYADCNTLEPIDAEMKINFTISKDIRWVAFEIYKGTVDEGEIIVYDTTWDSEITYIMPIPEYYSVRAKYQNGNTITYTVDGAKLDKNEVQKCDSICWEVSEVTLDLRVY